MEANAPTHSLISAASDETVAAAIARGDDLRAKAHSSERLQSSAE